MDLGNIQTDVNLTQETRNFFFIYTVVLFVGIVCVVVINNMTKK